MAAATVSGIRQSSKPRPARDIGPPPITSPYKGVTGLRRIGCALLCSLDGLSAAFKHEDAFRQEVAVAAILIPLAMVLPAGGAGKALMAGSVLLVLVVEMINSAVESAVDHISLETHPLAKRAKDMASAAVLLSLINVPLVWLLVLLG
jgi:diacylglycerol kinase (ATP)